MDEENQAFSPVLAGGALAVAFAGEVSAFLAGVSLLGASFVFSLEAPLSLGLLFLLPEGER